MPEIVYQPDNSALSPSILVSASQLLPNMDGSYRAPYPKVAGGIDGKGYTAGLVNAFLSKNITGGRRIVIGGGITTAFPNETSEIYAVAQGGTTWSTVATLSIATASTVRTTGWHFCQYENQIIAACKTFPTQTATTGNFAALTNAPHAMVVDTLNDAVWAWNVNVGATDYPDELWISDVGDPTDWTPAAGSLAFTIQLTECPGPGTAMIRFRDFMVIFKRRGMWLGQYTGDVEEPYEVNLFSANVGCIGKDACLVVEDTLYFADDQNVYAFDGATIRSIADTSFISKTLAQSILSVGVASTATPSNLQMHYDDLNKILSLYGPDTGFNPRSLAYCINTVSGKWGRFDAGSTYADSVQMVLNGPIEDLIAFGNLGVTASSNENRVNFAGTTLPSGVFQNGHNSDTAGAAVTAFFGAPFQAQSLRQVFMNADDNTGVTVADATKRSPRSSGTAQGSASATAFSTDMFAYLQCDGNFHKLTWAWNAQTHASPAAFRKWQGYDAELLRSGNK